ncbi:ABC transporter permease [Limimaricola pyoseonensis]|uniref:Peptide/nickel transport system permease protein n=1 Tax=Limimaricola pyoseonensis TaxID=521013 RepID=A0A1G7KSJ6_9RHOB|nr:ABC transporter permease [Limimaricola pyoseonensis]SDF40207.1 peptide/nickel transport system permease protein [Limimaricola pyoseonensis]
MTLLRTAPPTAIFGLLVLAATLLIGLFAPLVAPYGETEIVGAEYLPWSAEHPLGTDNLGRDMLSRMIFGARNTVGLALLTTGIAFSVGAALGMFAALKGGWVDQLMSRAVDVLMAVPPLILALMLLAIIGPSIPNMVGVIAVIYLAPVFRLSRAAAMNVVALDFIGAARLRGEGTVWLLRREILPNISSTLVAEAGLRFCFVFLFIAALSFLGIGIQPPTADWGSMVKENATLITFGDVTPLIPAGAIALLTVSINFIVDWMLHRASGLKS